MTSNELTEKISKALGASRVVPLSLPESQGPLELLGLAQQVRQLQQTPHEPTQPADAELESHKTE